MENQIKTLEQQNNDLHNEIMLLRNQNGEHIKSRDMGKNGLSSNQNVIENMKKGGLLIKNSKGGYISAGDAKLVIEQII